MGWEERSPGRKYFYYGKKVGRTVQKIYLGRGAGAQIVSLRIEVARAQRSHNLEVLAREVSRWAPLAAGVANLHAACAFLTAGTLFVSGYYQHHRGEWRPRHAQKSRRPVAER